MITRKYQEASNSPIVIDIANTYSEGARSKGALLHQLELMRKEIFISVEIEELMFSHGARNVDVI